MIVWHLLLLDMIPKPPDANVLRFSPRLEVTPTPKSGLLPHDVERFTAAIIEAEGSEIDTVELSADDWAVIDDEAAFRCRFGFDWPRLYRRWLLILKHDLDLTDPEIRLLQQTGNFDLDPRGISIVVRRWYWAYGWGQIACLGVFIGIPVALVASQNGTDLSAWQWITLCLWLMGSAAFARAVYLFYIRPFQIWRRVQAQGPVSG